MTQASCEKEATSAEAVDVLERDKREDKVGAADDKTGGGWILETGALEETTREVHQAVKSTELLGDKGHAGEEDGSASRDVCPDLGDAVREGSVLVCLNMSFQNANFCVNLFGRGERVNSRECTSGFGILVLLDEVSRRFGHEEVDTDDLDDGREGAESDDPTPADETLLKAAPMA